MEYLGTTSDGCEVYVDMECSHAATHFRDSPGLIEVVRKVIPTLTMTGDWLRHETDMGVVVGYSDLVSTGPNDEIVYALRPFRTQYSRFVKGKKAEPTTWLALDIRKIDGVYTLHTAFPGRVTPSFPGGNYLPEQSREFWANHALVWGTQEVIPESITSTCPW